MAEKDCLCHVHDFEIVYCSLREAAPELLAALKRIVRHADKYRSGGIYYGLKDAVEADRLDQEARNAIRKADGDG